MKKEVYSLIFILIFSIIYSNNVNAACNNDGECNDNNACTTDVCRNPGQGSNSYCYNPWLTDGSSCGGTNVCKVGQCVEKCVYTPDPDQCASHEINQYRCSGSSLQQCGNFDGDSCYEWGVKQTCGGDYPKCSAINGNCECQDNQVKSGSQCEICSAGSYQKTDSICNKGQVCGNTGNCVDFCFQTINSCGDPNGGSPKSGGPALCINCYDNVGIIRPGDTARCANPNIVYFYDVFGGNDDFDICRTTDITKLQGKLISIDSCQATVKAGQQYCLVLCRDVSNNQELCNNFDDNCNGQIDEGNIQRGCYEGPDYSKNADGTLKGICKAGTQTCSSGNFGSCIGQILPSAEICNDNLDNDCDGKIDELDEDCQCNLGAVSVDGSLCKSICTGTPRIECSQEKSSIDCDNKFGCEWKKQTSGAYTCVETITSCSGLNRESCNNVLGCSYIGGASDLCEPNENINVDAGYSGVYCPRVTKLQVDARDSSGSCDIQFTGGSLSGISLDTTNRFSTSGNFNGNWNIPSIPAACCGKKVSATQSSIWDGNIGNSNDWVDSANSVSGSFTFGGGLSSGCTSDADCCSGFQCVNGACGCPNGFSYINGECKPLFAACYTGSVGSSTADVGSGSVCNDKWRDPYTSSTSSQARNQPYWKDVLDTDEPDCFDLSNSQACCYRDTINNKEYGEFNDIIVKTSTTQSIGNQLGAQSVATQTQTI